jgi:cytochrome b6-f complex iron-sulfur subunit
MENKKTMDRKQFLAAIGISAAAMTVISCMGCSKSSGGGGNPVVNGPSGVDFTLDLTLAANAALLTNGGYLSNSGVLIARTLAGAYIAVQLSCTHQDYPLVYEASAHEFFCNNHGSAFTEAGVVKNSPANSNLAVYNTSLTNSSLRVYS